MTFRRLLLLCLMLTVLMGIYLPPASVSDPAAPRRDGPFGFSDPVRSVANAVQEAPRGELDACRLCNETLRTPIIHLTEAMADSVGELYSGFNQGLFAHMDSLYQAGRFGEPGSRGAKRQVHLLSRMLALNTMHYLVGFATDPDVIYEANEATLRRAFTRYSDPGIYPIVRLDRARMGQGWMCVQYNVSADMESTMTLGDKQVRVRIQETEIEGVNKRVLIMDLPTILFNTVEVLLDRHFSCKAELFHSPGPPAPHDIFLLHSMRGLTVRKWGVHKPDAMMFWSTPRNLQRQQLPNLPLVGSAIYVPEVRLELPSILPDLKFNDLRLLDLPQPILQRSYVQSKAYPTWMKRSEPRGFKDWDSHGPVPPDLQIRFPDL